MKGGSTQIFHHNEDIELLVLEWGSGRFMIQWERDRQEGTCRSPGQ